MAEPAPDRRLLILGGTAEAAELARLVHDRYGPAVHIITSLAGRLEPSQVVPGQVRIGGFGGIRGLGRYLVDEAIDVVVDATHPFADDISHHAVIACARAGVDRLALVRPPWAPGPGDRWEEVEDLRAAALRLPFISRRTFLAVGRGGLEPFAGIDRVQFLLRLFEPPEVPPLAGCAYEVIIARPPFTESGERALLERYRIDTVVARNSGGTTAPKLAAARAVGARVLLARRPPRPPGETVETADAALARLTGLL